jgi:hypothetical protein
MSRLSRYLALLVICSALATEIVPAQTTTVIPANEAAAHVGEYATVEGVVAKVFTSKAGNTFLNVYNDNHFCFCFHSYKFFQKPAMNGRFRGDD